MNAHGQSAAALHSFDTGTRMINGSNANNFLMEGSAAGNGTDDLLNESSLGLMALADPGLGLRDEDPELWVLTMSSELVSSLDGKEVKRQENMYEVIKTEKRHCVLLALMHHLFVGDMKKHGFSRQARLLFPDLKELLQVSSHKDSINMFSRRILYGHVLIFMNMISHRCISVFLRNSVNGRETTEP